MKYLIVKYAEQHFPNGKAPESASVFKTYSANIAGIEKALYNDKSEAAVDLLAISNVNPAVGYGIVELDEGELV